MKKTLIICCCMLFAAMQAYCQETDVLGTDAILIKNPNAMQRAFRDEAGRLYSKWVEAVASVPKGLYTTYSLESVCNSFENRDSACVQILIKGMVVSRTPAEYFTKLKALYKGPNRRYDSTSDIRSIPYLNLGQLYVLHGDVYCIIPYKQIMDNRRNGVVINDDKTDKEAVIIFKYGTNRAKIKGISVINPHN